MNSTDKAFVTAIIGVLLIISLSFLAGHLYSVSVDKKALEKGYTQTTIPGRAGAVWVLPDCTCSAEEEEEEEE